MNVSINYRLEPGGCSASAPTANCIIAIQEALADAQTAVRFLRTNAATYGIDPRSHRDRRLVRRRDHGAQRGVQLQRGSDRGGRRRGVALGRAPARHDRCRRRAEPAVPRHGRPDRAVPVGGEHLERRRSPPASTPSSRPGPAPGTSRTCSTAPRSSIRPRTSSTGSWIWRTRRSDRDGRGAGRQAAPRP